MTARTSRSCTSRGRWSRRGRASTGRRRSRRQCWTRRSRRSGGSRPGTPQRRGAPDRSARCCRCRLRHRRGRRVPRVHTRPCRCPPDTRPSACSTPCRWTRCRAVVHRDSPTAPGAGTAAEWSARRLSPFAPAHGSASCVQGVGGLARAVGPVALQEGAQSQCAARRRAASSTTVSRSVLRVVARPSTIGSSAR